VIIKKPKNKKKSSHRKTKTETLTPSKTTDHLSEKMQTLEHLKIHPEHGIPHHFRTFAPRSWHTLRILDINNSPSCTTTL